MHFQFKNHAEHFSGLKYLMQNKIFSFNQQVMLHWQSTNDNMVALASHMYFHVFYVFHSGNFFNGGFSYVLLCLRTGNAYSI